MSVQEAIRRVLEDTAFNSADHPRWPAGDPRGGKFAPKNAAGGPLHGSDLEQLLGAGAPATYVGPRGEWSKDDAADTAGGKEAYSTRAEAALMSATGPAGAVVHGGSRGSLATNLKDTVVARLAERAGIGYDQANTIVHQWANSANDTDMRSLSVQQAIAAEFGTPLSPWQRSQIDTLTANRGVLDGSTRPALLLAMATDIQTLASAAVRLGEKDVYKLRYEGVIERLSHDERRALDDLTGAGSIYSTTRYGTAVAVLSVMAREMPPALFGSMGQPGNISQRLVVMAGWQAALSVSTQFGSGHLSPEDAMKGGAALARLSADPAASFNPYAAPPGHPAGDVLKETNLYSTREPLADQPTLRRVVRAMYDLTQEDLKASGFTGAVLYRGASPMVREPGGGWGNPRYLTGSMTAARRRLPNFRPWMQNGAMVRTPTNASSSYASTRRAASNFGSMVTVRRVRPEEILSTPRTGFGCWDEHEFVVLGGRDGYAFERIHAPTSTGSSIIREDEWAPISEAVRAAPGLAHGDIWEMDLSAGPNADWLHMAAPESMTKDRAIHKRLAERPRRGGKAAVRKVLEATAFNSADHPRYPAGDPRGGEFAPKDGGVGGLRASKHPAAPLPPGAVGFVDPPKGPAGVGFSNGHLQIDKADPASLVRAGRGLGAGVVSMAQHQPYWLGVKYPTQEAALAAADAALKRNQFYDDEVCYVVKGGVIEFAIRGEPGIIRTGQLPEPIKERMRGADFTHSHPGGYEAASVDTLSGADLASAYVGGFRIRAISPTTNSVWEFEPHTFGRPVRNADGELSVGHGIAAAKKTLEIRMDEAVTRVMGREIWLMSETSGPVGRAILGSAQVAAARHIADQGLGRLRHVSRDPQNEASLSKLLRTADWDEVRKQVANPQGYPSAEAGWLPPTSLDISEGVSAVPLPDIDDRDEFAMANRGARPRRGRRAVRKVLEATAFNSADHPRHPAGDSRGGKFAPKGGGRAGIVQALRGLTGQPVDAGAMAVHSGDQDALRGRVAGGLTPAQSRHLAGVMGAPPFTTDIPPINLTPAQIKALKADDRWPESEFVPLRVHTGSVTAAIALTDAALRAMPRATDSGGPLSYDGRERAYLIDRHGTVLGLVDGDNNSVRLMDVPAALVGLRGLTVNHNHPAGTTFPSRGDQFMVIRPKPTGLGITVGPAGTIHANKTPEEPNLDIVAIRAVTQAHATTFARTRPLDGPGEREAAFQSLSRGDQALFRDLNLRINGMWNGDRASAQRQVDAAERAKFLHGHIYIPDAIGPMSAISDLGLTYHTTVPGTSRDHIREMYALTAPPPAP